MRKICIIILVFNFLHLNVISQEDLNSFISATELLKKNNYSSFYKKHLKNGTLTKEKSIILSVKKKELENDLMGRFVVLINIADEKNEYSKLTLAWANYHLSSFLSQNKLYNEALKRNAISYQLACEINSKQYKHLTLMNAAGINFAKNNYSKAYEYYKNCLPYSNKIFKASNYNNLGLCKKKMRNYTESLNNYKKGLLIINGSKNIHEKEVFYLIYGNIGSIYFELDKLDSAEMFLIEENNFYKKNNIHSLNRISTLIEITLLKKKQDRNYKAELNEILTSIKNINGIESKYMAIQSLDKSLYPHLSPNEKNIFYSISYNILNKYFSKRSEQQIIISKILLNDKINSIRKSRDIEQKQLTLERKNNHYKTTLLFISLLILIILLIFIYKIQKQRKIQQKNESLIAQQKEDLFETKQQLLKNELNLKHQQLQTLNINLKIKTETEEVFLKKIKEIKKKKDLNIDSIINEIQLGIQNLKEIDKKLYLSKVENNISNQAFINQIRSLHPELSDNEIAFCQFCLIDLSSKEISQITGQSEGAVRVYKNKIKNKLHLEKDDDLNKYLKQICSSKN